MPETESEISFTNEPVTKVASSGNVLSSIVDYEFLAAKDPEKWGSVVGLDNRFEVCSVPEDMIAGMSTVDMASLIVHFKLYLNVDHDGHTVAYSQADIIATPY